MSGAARVLLGRRQLFSAVVLISLAGMLLAALVGNVGTDRLAFDFNAVYLPAAESVRAGGSPYDSSGLLPYVYPPVLAELLVPSTYLPEDVSSFLAFVASVAAVMGALAVVGVRDVRCYAAVVIWAPGWNSFEMANVTALLALMAALVWRYRDTTASRCRARRSAVGEAIPVAAADLAGRDEQRANGRPGSRGRRRRRARLLGGDRVCRVHVVSRPTAPGRIRGQLPRSSESRMD